MGVYIKGYNIEGLKDMLEHCGAEPYLLDVINMTRVPEPHGRLIDADFEEKHYASMTINPTPDVTPQDYMHSGYAAKAFQMAKTVIEAEGE